MKKRFSLIVATYGRYVELEEFLNSIVAQNYDLTLVEIYIVDQNDKIDLSPLIERYKPFFSIYHFQSNKRGLSYNRNVALAKVSGEIIAFPDDDCCYYPDTLLAVNEIFVHNPSTDIVLGRIYDRLLHKNIIRNWNKNTFSIRLSNFYLNYSSITIFTRRSDIYFDENLGVGTKFASYEDADYIIRSLKEKKTIQYHPTIEVWHPEQNVNCMNENKIYQYGLGFGGLCRKHISFFALMLFLKAIIFHTIKLLIVILQGNNQQARKRVFSIKSRIEGFFSWNMR